MNLPGNGIFVVRGEMAQLMTSMKRYQRNSWNYRYDQSDNLTKKLNILKEKLNKVEDLKLLQPEDFLGPFLEAIRSEEVPGNVTSLALLAVNKFLSYGLIDPTNASKMTVVQNIADAVTHARFVGGDNNSDGVVLLRIVQVLKTLMLSPEGNFLTNESVCEIILSCFRICFEMRLNELLRKTAEQALRDMIHLLFMRLPQFVEDLDSSTLNHLKIRSDQAKSSKNKPTNFLVERQQSNQKSDSEKLPNDSGAVTDDITPQIDQISTESTVEQPQPIVVEEEISKPQDSVDNVSEDVTKIFNDNELKPYGIPCVRELFRFLISLCNPLDPHNTESILQIALDLLTVVFEVSSDNLANYFSLTVLVKDELCRSLFSLLQSEKMNLIASSLRLSFLLFESLRFHLKFQLEFFVLKLMDIITTDNPKFTHEIKELALENIMQLLQIPGFAAEVYINYDCDLYCDDVFEKLTKLLSKNVLFTSATHMINGIQVLSLEALLAIIGSINKNCELSKIGNKPSYMRHSRNNSVSRPELITKDVNFEDQPLIDGKLERHTRYISTVARFSEKIKSGETIDDKKIEELRGRKRMIAQGTELFNQKPDKGISFLQENGILNSNLDPLEVALFLRESPGLDKKMIGEYISKKKNVEKGILDAFVTSFDFLSLRIDKALRLYLETFRLPGEAPLIFMLLEEFGNHYQKCNNDPFDNSDAAFRLAYAIIMLNMDQHNHNAKKLNIPMTVDDFIKNLRGLNGKSGDYDQEMLTDIFNAIKNEEIVMPAEQTGLVKENYLWKVLLRRGETKDGEYLMVFDSIYDKHLFQISWGSTLSALGSLFDKVAEVPVIKKIMEGFIESAAISSYYNLHEEFDAIVLTLCKFTTIYNITETNANALQVSVQFGTNSKARTAMKSVFKFVHDFGDSLRDSWKHVIKLIIQLYKLNLLPKNLVEVEDFCETMEKARLQYEPVQITKPEGSFISSLYSYLSSDSQRQPTMEEQEILKVAKKCIKDCQIEQIIVETKFLHNDSLNEMFLFFQSSIKPPTSHTSVGELYEENLIVFHIEFFIKVIIQNRDRVLPLWPQCNDIFQQVIMGASACGYHFLLKRTSIGFLKLAVYLMRNEDLASTVLQSLKVFLELKPVIQNQLAVPISIGMYEVLKTSAQNIHTENDWSIVFNILECFGAGVVLKEFEHTKSDGAVSSDDETEMSDRGYLSDSELLKISTPQHDSNWIIIDKSDNGEKQKLRNVNSIAYECKLIKHSPFALVKCWDSLAFIVRNVAHITPYNFELCVKCIRIFVEASMTYGRKHNSIKEKSNKRNKKNSSMENDEEIDRPEILERYQTITIQLLDLMHTLHTRTAQIFRWWAEEGGSTPQNESALWIQGWCPLLQGIARISTDYRKQVRTNAITILQRALLMHDLQTLTGYEWAGCFKFVLFPLMSFLLKETTENNGTDGNLIEESRIRVSTIVSKVFLHHLTPLMTLESFSELWLEVLKFMESFMKLGMDMLYEAVLESLKNMLLVMYSVRAFHNPDGISHSQLWDLTWSRIEVFHPTLKVELFKSDETPMGKLHLNPDFLPSKQPQASSSQIRVNDEPARTPENVIEVVQNKPNVLTELYQKNSSPNPIIPSEHLLHNIQESPQHETSPALHQYERNIPQVIYSDNVSEASSIELVIQGGPEPHQIPSNGEMRNFMPNFQPFTPNLVTDLQDSDIYYEYVSNPYNNITQISQDVKEKDGEIQNFCNNDSTMFQSASYFNVHDTKDLLSIENPKDNSSKHELFDQS